jgi:hypothetical protein
MSYAPSGTYNFPPSHFTYNALSQDGYSGTYSPAAISNASFTFGDYQLPVPPARLSSPPLESSERPSINHEVASKATRRLVCGELRKEGYYRGEPQALERLEKEVEACELPSAARFSLLKCTHASYDQPLSACA